MIQEGLDILLPTPSYVVRRAIFLTHMYMRVTHTHTQNIPKSIYSNNLKNGVGRNAQGTVSTI